MCVPFLFLIHTLPQKAADWSEDSGGPLWCAGSASPNPATHCPAPQKGAKRSTYSSKAHHWRSAIGSGGGGGSGTHLGREVVEAGVSAGAGERAVHLMVAHHGKGCCVGAGDGDGRAQG